MKISELIEHLKTFDQDLPVYVPEWQSSDGWDTVRLRMEHIKADKYYFDEEKFVKIGG